MLCICGSVDDITFSHNGANGEESNTTLCFVEFVTWRPGAKSDVYDCLVQEDTVTWSLGASSSVQVEIRRITSSLDK